jgi:hypothetical protein
MPTEGLEGNFLSILSDTVPRRVPGKAAEKFIISCILKTPTAGYEEFKVDLSKYLEEIAKRRSLSRQSQEDSEPAEAATAVASG